MRPVAHACESQSARSREKQRASLGWPGSKWMQAIIRSNLAANHLFGSDISIILWGKPLLTSPHNRTTSNCCFKGSTKNLVLTANISTLYKVPHCIDVLTWIAGTKHCSAISALTTRNLPSICHTEMCCVPSRSEASDCKVARFAVPLVPGTVGVCSASSAWHCWRDWITAATLLTTDQPTWWCRPPIGQISSSALEISKKQNLSMKFYTKASLGLLPWWFIFLLIPP